MRNVDVFFFEIIVTYPDNIGFDSCTNTWTYPETGGRLHNLLISGDNVFTVGYTLRGLNC